MKTLLLCILWAASVAAFTSYEGCKLYELNLESTRQQHAITSFVANELYDFWSKPARLGLPVIVMVYPEAQAQFLNILGVEEISYKVLSENIEDEFKSERIRQNYRNRKQGQITFENYNRYGEIESNVQRLTRDYPNIVKLEQFQTTYEGRAMWLLKIGTENPSKPTILIDGGIHARECISPAVVLYIIQQLVENKENKHMIENVNWYIIPVLNPDGYEYTFTNERLWRRNRAPIVGSSECNGTDLNRNFGFHWGEAGSSSEPCNDIFRGRFAFDQLESRGLRDVVYRYKDQIKLYLTFHSDAQIIVYPWGYTKELPENAAELQSLGEQVAAAIGSVRGTLYRVGNVPHLLPLGAGGSDDWVKGGGGVELSYTVELPGYIFHLPLSEILDVCVESFEGVKVYHHYIENKFQNS